MTGLKLDSIIAVKFPAKNNLQMARLNCPCNFCFGEKKKIKIPELYHIYIYIYMLNESSHDVSSCLNDFKNFRLYFSLINLRNGPTSEYTRT